ncbi:MAG: hypothetical protein IPO81_01965 [Kouleothrix sp.]|nr:hypothetical protein [Kouleothrix sp.]
MSDHRQPQSAGSNWPKHPMRELLPAYATAVALGLPRAVQYALLEIHLAQCAQCQVELDDLLEMIDATATGQIEPAPAYPQANLSFLGPPPKPPALSAPAWSFGAGRLVVDIPAPLLGASRQAGLAGAARGRLLYRYVQEPGSVADLEVAIEVYAEDGPQHQGRVRVSVDVPSRGPFDQTGSVVVVHANEATWSGETDETGSIDFAPVPLGALPHLRVEITPP